ncbi:MAG: helix-turn-helix domain-containing protein, partial [Candidatus Parcubacteria bacterium]|nr:helix-turn-helix domain-containing protein [Candidatus Parcubacteria bacterium]
MNIPHSKKFIGTKEASELSGYNPDHLSRLARSGEIEAVRVGRTWHVEHESLMSFLRKQGRQAKEIAGYISTREASKRYGYNADYLARLARSGEVVGSQVGRTWLMNRESLDSFFKRQEERKEARLRALARAREKEYLLHQGVQKDFARQEPRAKKIVPSTPARPAPHAVPQSPFTPIVSPYAFSYRTSVRAFVVALFVVLSGSVVAQSGVVGQLASGTAAVAHEFSEGLGKTFGGVAGRFATRIKSVAEGLPSRHVSTERGAGMSASLREITLPDFHVPAIVTEPRTSAPSLVAEGKSVMNGWRSDAIGVFSFLSSPSQMMRSLAGLSHMLIRADVSLAYGIATAAPEVSAFTLRSSSEVVHATVALIGGAAAQLPALATAAYLRAAEAPAELAPRIAQAVFDVEYAGATRFVALTGAVTERYLALVHGTGRVAYEMANATDG